MAFSIAQHQISASATTGTPTASLTWSPAPSNGHLLVVALNFRSTATVTESTAQGWTRAIFIAQGASCQTEIWYRVAGASEGTTGPAFNTAAVLYEIAQAEVSGFTGTPTLDKTGTATGSGFSASIPAVNPAITAGSEFCFACCGDAQGATASIVFNASTAAGGATFGADIDAVNPPKNGEGLRDAWATSGASGTLPSITMNLSSASNTVLASVIATFQDVAAAPANLPESFISRQARPRAVNW